MGTGEIFITEAGGAGEGGVSDHGIIVEDGAEVEVGFRVSGGLLFGTNVVDGEDDDGFGGTDCRVPGIKVIVHQLPRLVAVVHHRVDESDHLLKFVLGEDELGKVGWGIVDFHSETSDYAEVVAGSTEAPPEVGIGLFRDGNGFATGEDDICVDEIVCDETIKALVPSETATKTGSHYPYAGTATGGRGFALAP